MTEDDPSLLQGIRRGDASAWERLIARYEGRLLAYAESRLFDRVIAEDVVQEAFLGFLTALPNYDEQTPLESFLFSIAAHKLTDVLRKKGRRPAIPFVVSDDSRAEAPRTGRDRKASSLARSVERRGIEERVLGECLRSLIQSWISRGEFERLKCIELLFVTGLGNKDVANRLDISEQAVANHKSFVVGKLREFAHAARLRDVDWERHRCDTDR